MQKLRLLYVLFSLCLISTICFSQEIITYDEETQTFCIDIHDCDPCILGEEDSQICYCREDCLDVADQFLIDCLATANGLLDIQRCKDLASQRVHFCKEDCGAEPEWPYIDHIQVSINVVGASIPLHPIVELNANGDFIELGGHGIAIDEEKYELDNFYSQGYDCVDLSDEDLSELNFCIAYTITIFIGESGTQDRRVCEYSDFHCIING